MQDDQVLLHAACTVPESFNWTNKHYRFRIWKPKSGNLTGDNIITSCGFLLFVVYEFVFAHLVSLIPLPGFYSRFYFPVLRPLSILMPLEKVAELFVTFNAPHKHRVCAVLFTLLSLVVRFVMFCTIDGFFRGGFASNAVLVQHFSFGSA